MRWKPFALASGVAIVALVALIVLRATFAGEITISPVAFSLGSIEVRWYGIFISISLAIGLPWTLRRMGGSRISQVEKVLWWAIAGGFVGARLAYVAQNLGEYGKDPVAILAVSSGGLSIHGMLLGGLVVAAVAARVYRIDIRALADATVPALLFGMTLGRFGNFTNVEILGTPTDLPWKLFVPVAARPVSLGDAAYVHPIFLYDALLNGALLILLLRTQRTTLFRGELFFRFLFGISLTRFVVEFVRLNDPISTGGLSPAQYVSLGLGGLSLALIALGRSQFRSQRV